MGADYEEGLEYGREIDVSVDNQMVRQVLVIALKRPLDLGRQYAISIEDGTLEDVHGNKIQGVASLICYRKSRLSRQ